MSLLVDSHISPLRTKLLIGELGLIHRDDIHTSKDFDAYQVRVLRLVMSIAGTVDIANMS